MYIISQKTGHSLLKKRKKRIIPEALFWDHIFATEGKILVAKRKKVGTQTYMSKKVLQFVIQNWILMLIKFCLSFCQDKEISKKGNYSSKACNLFDNGFISKIDLK